MAGATGLEPAASCVTGRRSNQLNYAPAWDKVLTLLLCLLISPGYFLWFSLPAFSPSQPLGFTAAFPKREIQVGIHLDF